MPLYEYECRECGRRFEKIQKFSDPSIEHCEHCGGAVTRLVSASAIQFKGSGWYVTDYARKSGNGKEKTEKTEKTEKPATKSESDTASSPAKPASETSSKPESKS